MTFKTKRQFNLNLIQYFDEADKKKIKMTNKQRAIIDTRIGDLHIGRPSLARKNGSAWIVYECLCIKCDTVVVRSFNQLTKYSITECDTSLECMEVRHMVKRALQLRREYD
jgi:hypothetical protein